MFFAHWFHRWVLVVSHSKQLNWGFKIIRENCISVFDNSKNKLIELYATRQASGITLVYLLIFSNNSCCTQEKLKHFFRSYGSLHAKETINHQTDASPVKTANLLYWSHFIPTDNTVAKDTVKWSSWASSKSSIFKKMLQRFYPDIRNKECIILTFSITFYWRCVIFI